MSTFSSVDSSRNNDYLTSLLNTSWTCLALPKEASFTWNDKCLAARVITGTNHSGLPVELRTILFSVTQVPKLTYTCHIVSWLLLSTVTKIMLSHERNPWYNSRWSPSHPSVPSPDFPEGLTRILVSLSSSWRHHILPELRSHSVNELLIVVELDQRSASLAIGYTSLKLLVPLNTGWNSTARTVWFWLWCRSGREFFLQHFLVLSFYLEFLTTAVHALIFFFFASLVQNEVYFSESLWMYFEGELWGRGEQTEVNCWYGWNIWNLSFKVLCLQIK